MATEKQVFILTQPNSDEFDPSYSQQFAIRLLRELERVASVPAVPDDGFWRAVEDGVRLWAILMMAKWQIRLIPKGGEIRRVILAGLYRFLERFLHSEA